MKQWTEKELREHKYEIENAKITSVDLSMADHGAFCLSMAIEGNNWSCVFGGHLIGKGYLGAEEFEGSPMGIEYIMTIMNVVGVSHFNDMAGKYIRVVTANWGCAIQIIGNVIEDKWFDVHTFFGDKE